MPSSFLSDDAWVRIGKLVRSSRQAWVAVAYFSKGGAARLPLKRGSVLAVDFSLVAIRSGRTDPREVLKLIRKGVAVYSVANLHAKVFVFDKTLVVGSTNVSANSAGRLIEAVIETRDVQMRKQALTFIDGLRGDAVGPAHAEAMVKEYREPKYPIKGRRGSKSKPKDRRVRPAQSGIWAVALDERGWDDEDQAAEARALPKAMQHKRHGMELDKFTWPANDRLGQSIVRGERLVQVVETSTGWKGVCPPGRVIHVHRYKKRNEPQIIVFLEIPRGCRRRELGGLRKRLGIVAQPLTKLKFAGKRLRDPALIYELGRLWPSVQWDLG